MLLRAIARRPPALRQTRLMPPPSSPPLRQARRHFLLPPPGSTSNSIGFTTYAMWGLCLVVLGVCYYFEQNEEANKPKPLPPDVQKVMHNGAWLMKDGSIRPAVVEPVVVELQGKR